MEGSRQPTARPPPSGSVFRVINVPMRAVLSLPFATPLSGRLMLAYIPAARLARSPGTRT